MEGYPARSVVSDDFTSSEAVDARRASEQSAWDGASHTACFLPSLLVSVSSDGATPAFEAHRSQAYETESTLRPHEELLMMRTNNESYQPLTPHASWSPEGSYDGAASPLENVEFPTAASDSQWRPTYLRRRVLVAFSALFLLMIASLELLGAISARNNGIARGFNKDHYLWTYGPTAFLTLIAALFNRVEYQAKIMAPWERLYKGPTPARKTLLLDYVSPLQPVAIYESLRNKDFAVAATTTISVLIKLLIVLSSGLITLSRVGVHHLTIPMEVQDTFVDDDSLLGAGNTVPYFILQGLIQGSSLPKGISNKYAFQLVQSQLPVTAQYQVTVDGLMASLECEIAELDATAVIDTNNSMESIMNLTFRSPDCDIGPGIYYGPPLWPQDTPIQLAVGRFQPVQCAGPALADDTSWRALIMFGLEEWVVNETIPIEGSSSDCTGSDCDCTGSDCDITTVVSGTLLESAQLLCTPRYEITKVNVVQNGTEVQSVMPVHQRSGEYSSRTLDRVRPWSIMDAYFHYCTRVLDRYDEWATFNISQESMQLDPCILSLVEDQITTGTDLSSLYNPNFVQSLATTYYQQVGAIIAKQLLMKPTSLNTTGSAIIMDDRLIAREWAVQSMVGVILICTVLSILSVFVIPRHGILRRSPSTLPGIAALVAQSPDLLEQLRFSGDAVSKTLCLQLDGSRFHSEVIHHPSSGPGEPNKSFIIKDAVLADTGESPNNVFQSESPHAHPWILHPASRLGLGLILIALVATLEVTLYQSRSHDGLGNVGDNAYIHYTWTSIPTLVFGGLAMVLSSIDFSIRSLAPYTSLSEVITAAAFRTLDFLDMSVPSAIINETKLRNIGALATTTTLLFASFYTVFSGSLFQGVSLSSTTVALLRANNSFGSTSDDIDFGVNAALILLGNLSYPSFTYEDLAFPQLSPTMALTANEMSNTPLLSINAVVPALRPHLECRSYDKNMIRFEIIHGNDSSDIATNMKGDFLDIAVNEGCSYRDDPSFWNARLQILANTSYFGVGPTQDSDEPRVTFASPCRNYLFIWGKMDPLTDFKVEHIAAMGCNMSIEAVDVDTNFIGASLAIDLDNPPQPVAGSERNPPTALGPPFGFQFLYSAPTIPTPHILSHVFALLTQSRWAIPLSMLGGGSDEAVAAALKFQHGVFLAQALNECRVPAAETNATLTPEQALAGENDAGLTFEATVVDKEGRQRVVQDAISTRVLEALLLVTLVLLGVGWVWLPKTNALPKRSPMTIASAVALLAGGNLEEWVNEMDADTTGVYGGRGATTRFWMGWGDVPDEEGILMGNENENGISRFGIFAVKVDQVDEK